MLTAAAFLVVTWAMSPVVFAFLVQLPWVAERAAWCRSLLGATTSPHPSGR